MAIFDAVRAAVQRLAPRGWRTLLLNHGLDLGAANLAAELSRTLSGIDRARPGFQDFSLAGKRAIEPGNPALSLLYHALASPAVHPGAAATGPDYPSLDELDAIENYIYALSKKKFTDFPNAVIAVFAYQYRTGARSQHEFHADMSYSRTGTARVGTKPMHYDPMRRSFWIEPANGAKGIAVMPARYGAFLAIRRKPGASDAILHKRPGDGQRTFLFPVHKLFAGNECFTDKVITELTFAESHRSEKLRRIHLSGGIPVIPGFDINKPPFVRDSADLVKLVTAGASTLVVPLDHPALVRTATQRNSISGNEEVLRFEVPKAKPANNPRNRFAESSYLISSDRGSRHAPEYVHIRTEVNAAGNETDLNLLTDAAFSNKLGDGAYAAAHYLDDSCEGILAAQVKGLPATTKRFAAYSLVSAPDFLPLVDQMEVHRWMEERGLQEGYFEQGHPDPLSDGRDNRTANPQLLDPVTKTAPGLDRNDAANRTIVAVVGPAARSPGVKFTVTAGLETSWLTSAGANVFEPGWDVSIDSDAAGEFYAGYGLGSPFPEDAKLCAALNSFWPAAAPDVGRTFGGFTGLPHTDQELGFHPNHPKVLKGEAVSAPGWDGEFGPFFVNNNKKASFARLERSDYTRSALEGRIGPGLLQQIDAVEELARMDGYRDCVVRLHFRLGSTDAVAETLLRLVTVEKVADWAPRTDRLNNQLSGAGYLYVFATLRDGTEKLDGRRFTQDVDKLCTCQFTATKLVTQINQGAIETVTRP